MNLQQLFALEADGADTYVGEGLEYPWGGLYGGHIVAQALRAAAFTVSDEVLPHSLRAYFIRRGDNTQPVRYEVDRIRDGRSFGTLLPDKARARFSILRHRFIETKPQLILLQLDICKTWRSQTTLKKPRGVRFWKGAHFPHRLNTLEMAPDVLLRGYE